MTEISVEARERIAQINAEKSDWWKRCRLCKKVRTGTIAELTTPCQCEPQNV